MNLRSWKWLWLWYDSKIVTRAERQSKRKGFCKTFSRPDSTASTEPWDKTTKTVEGRRNAEEKEGEEEDEDEEEEEEEEGEEEEEEGEGEEEEEDEKEEEEAD